ncbi:threonylcarbamoyl-AMP synthase [Ornithinimicrobium sp. Arc0846-15]|nr:threonylcarbamoyl-AMP synthase [Ornithinimicrobium laminariae]
MVECSDPEGRNEAIDQAVEAVRNGQIVVLPTDTVYGVGADAFDDVAVAMVLAAKRRGREMPPPVLVPHARTVDGLATKVPMYAKILMRRFWPGPLTLVLRAQQSLMWDLGDANGTVALRMPDDEVALALLEKVGPMAVTSANLTGQPAATTAQEAQGQLAGAVEVYLDGGVRTNSAASTIVDCTGDEPVILRHGALSGDTMREVLGATVLHDEPVADAPAEDEPQNGETEAPDSETETAEMATVEDGTGADSSGAGLNLDHGARLIGSVQDSGVAFRRGALTELYPVGSGSER